MHHMLYIFFKHTQTSKLSGELTICPMTIGRVQMRETPNSYLRACLVMVGIRALTVLCNAPILPLRRTSLGRYETLLRPGRKPIHE